MDSSELIHKRILDKKWKSLGNRGYIRARDEGENIRRRLEARAEVLPSENSLKVGTGNKGCEQAPSIIP
jgi:hypothetical protein